MLQRQIISSLAIAALGSVLAGAAMAQQPSTGAGSAAEAPPAGQARDAERSAPPGNFPAPDQTLERERRLFEQELAQQQMRLQEQEMRLQEQEMVAHRAELEAMRAQLEVARRELEEAARDVATRRLMSSQPGVAGAGPARPEATLGLAVTDSPRGVVVTRVTPGSSAAAAGVQAGDVVRSVNGAVLTGGVAEPSIEFASRVEAINPGDRVAVVIDRAGTELPLNIRAQRSSDDALSYYRWLQKSPGTTAVVRSDNAESVLWTLGLASRLWSDMELVTLTEELGRYFSTSEGLLVIRAPSDAELDLIDGDVLLAISGRPPTSPEHAMRILASFEPGETIELAIMRQGAPRTVSYVLPPGEPGWR